MLQNIGLFEIVENHTKNNRSQIIDITLKGVPVYERMLRDTLNFADTDELRVYFDKKNRRFTKNSLYLMANVACVC